MENKKTAVEWFIEKTIESGHLCVTDTPSDMTELGKLIEQAKEFEKKLICDAYTHGYSNGQVSSGLSQEKYYENTYKEI